MEDKICIIVGAGDFSEKEIIKGKNDLLIAADGGLLSLERIGLTPDIIIGDFDSLLYTPNSDNTVILPREKDVTDTAAAIHKGIEKGYEKFRIYGGTGGREDHTLANIQNLVKLTKKGFFGEIIDKNKVITALYNGKMNFDKSYKGVISVFSHSDKSEGVFEKGFKYNLDNATLTNSEPLGVSNEFIGKEAEIGVENGVLLIIYDRQNG